MNLLIIDLEATCWESPNHRPNEMETIEIGAVLIDPKEHKTQREYQTFVRPIRNPQLSEFCMALTAIRQEDVDRAKPFRDEFSGFLEWVGNPNEVLLCSWGEYDRKQLISDCRYHDIQYPFGERHFNIKRYFADRLECKRLGMGQALRKLGIELEGVHHRALDDAKNICRILTAITNGELNIITSLYEETC